MAERFLKRLDIFSFRIYNMSIWNVRRRDDTMTLKEARRRAGISQCQLAALAGVTQSMICKIERYGNRPSPRVAEKIAAALNLTTAEMWDMLYADSDGGNQRESAEH